MNLFCYVPNDEDATSFYRAVPPLAALKRDLMKNDLNITFAGKEVYVKDLAPMDAIFIQRPFNPDHLKLIWLAKSLKIKVWLDFDDNFFCVPENNPASQIYSNPEIQKILPDILKLADVISVSTQALKQDYEKRVPGVRIEVIPNAFNDYLLTMGEASKPHNLVFWRGTQSHESDLHRFSESIGVVSQNQPKWLFNFMGYRPWFLLDQLGKNGVYTPPIDILKYHEVLKLIYPAISMITLTDSLFNRCKSNIAWIEATYAGAIAIAPKWEEWEKPGVTCYEYPERFSYQLVTRMSMDPYKLAELHKESKDYIMAHLKLSHVNQLRKSLLESLQ